MPYILGHIAGKAAPDSDLIELGEAAKLVNPNWSHAQLQQFLLGAWEGRRAAGGRTR